MGPPTLVDRLQDRHRAMIARAMLRRLGDVELAQDATQDALEAIARNFHAYDPARGSFEAWILGYVELTARAAWRRHAARPEPREHLPEDGAEDARLDRLPAEWRQAINALPLLHRRLLLLRGVEGWPAEAVGRRLGMTPTNVNTTFARICVRLQKRLDRPDAA